MSTDEATWAYGLAALPGASYVPPAGAPLMQGCATPTASERECNGAIRRSLFWKTEGGSTSASPASRHAADQVPDAPTADLLWDLHDGLAKSSTPSDYHFAIQRAIDALWKRRRDDLQAVSDIEPLCLTDISIVET